MAEFLRGGDGVVHGGEETFALAERIHRAGLDETFQRALIENARVDVVTEIENGFELVDTSAGFNDGASCSFADILNCGETEADCFADGSEIQVAGIYVRRKDGDAHAARLR